MRCYSLVYLLWMDLTVRKLQWLATLLERVPGAVGTSPEASRTDIFSEEGPSHPPQPGAGQIGGSQRQPSPQALGASLGVGTDQSQTGMVGGVRIRPNKRTRGLAQHQHGHTGPWGQRWAKTGPGSASPMAKPGRAVKNQRLTLLWHCWSTAWWSQGLTWGPGPRVGVGRPLRVGQGLSGLGASLGPLHYLVCLKSENLPHKEKTDN